MQAFRWGLVGPGRIAHKFAEVATRLPGSTLAAVHGRTAERREAFAQRWGARAVPKLDALLQPGAVDAIYIATPHSEHAELAVRCLQAGVPVLCEKPLVATAAQAEALVALARARRVFLMEALWTRFLPLYAHVGRWLQDGAIGELHAVHSSFCFEAPYDPSSRLFNAALAGGALLDIGVYNVAMSRWAFEACHGRAPQTLHAEAHGLLAPSGVDRRVHASLRFEHGVTAQFTCSLDSHAANALHLIGSAGAVVVPRLFWHGPQAELWRGRECLERVQFDEQINGFEGQVQAAMAAICAGRTECPGMPLDESLALAQTLERLRRQLGVRYPFEGAGREPGS
jgi:predicted dehydrogenase